MSGVGGGGGSIKMGKKFYRIKTESWAQDVGCADIKRENSINFVIHPSVPLTTYSWHMSWQCCTIFEQRGCALFGTRFHNYDWRFPLFTSFQFINHDRSQGTLTLWPPHISNLTLIVFKTVFLSLFDDNKSDFMHCLRWEIRFLLNR